MTLVNAVDQAEAQFVRRWVGQPSRKPRRSNGEHEVEQLLLERGLKPQYEPWSYPLSSGFAFTPDFWIPETGYRPEFHVEVTWLDMALARELRRVLAAEEAKGNPKRLTKLCRRKELLTERWERKQSKVRELKQLYGIETILISQSRWVDVMVSPQTLDKLLGSIGLTLVS